MKTLREFESGADGGLIALSVFPNREDHAVLQGIFCNSDRPLCPDSKWTLRTCQTLEEALPFLRQGGIAFVVCACGSEPGGWKEVLEALNHVADPPYLIVTSKHADDRLWAEALNLGVYDVLPAPLEPAEVIRTLSVAWLRWRDRHKVALPAVVQSAA